MRTLVLGGGVAGVTTAYFLARAGHEVTLVEQQASLGLEATSGNAGIIAPGHSFAWASPRAPRMLWESLRGAETAIRKYVELAREHGLDPAQMALAFVNARPFVTANIIGATSMAQLETAIGSIDVKLPSEVEARIDAIHQLHSNPCP